MDNKDKAQVRANILEVFMLQTDESMRDLFAECVLGIVRDDFPQQWNCIPEILKNLSCNYLNRVHNALLITRKIVKLYQFARRTDTEERKRLHIFSSSTRFPLSRKSFKRSSTRTNRLQLWWWSCVWKSTGPRCSSLCKVRKRPYRCERLDATFRCGSEETSEREGHARGSRGQTRVALVETEKVGSSSDSQILLKIRYQRTCRW